ncbi:MAG TPA: hypothetical protein PLT07_12785, partial [Trueperaceae bacterium]|nr:hypothetical protein [Trueperaceae bacterium]
MSGDESAPREGEQRAAADDVAQGGDVGGADGAADEDLRGNGYPVEQVGDQQERLHQHLIGGQGQGAEAGAAFRDQGEADGEEEGPHDYVCVRREELPPRAPLEDRGRRLAPQLQRQAAERQHYDQDDGGQLRQHRSGGGAGNTPAEAEDEGKRQRRVEAVEEELHEHDGPPGAEAHEPGRQRRDGEGERSAPHAHLKVRPAEGR